MSHTKTITALNALIKRKAISFDPADHISHLRGESDRSFIILHAATLEDILTAYLEFNMKTLNSDEMARLFNFEGPLGSFSNRIRFAQAVQLITRETKRRFEVVKTMRNAAAHSLGPLSFDTKEIRDATIQLLEGGQDRSIASGWNAQELRNIFGLVCVHLSSVIGTPDQSFKLTAVLARMHGGEQPSSPNK